MSKQNELEHINQTMKSVGWTYIEAMLDGMIQAPKDEALEALAYRPDEVTIPIAIAKSSRSRGLSDFKEELYALVAPLNPKGQGSR